MGYIIGNGMAETMKRPTLLVQFSIMKFRMICHLARRW